MRVHGYGDSLSGLALIVLVIMISGCYVLPELVGQMSDEAEVQVTEVPGPPGSYGYTAWLDDGLVVDYWREEDNRTIYSSRLWRLQPDGSDMEMLQLPAHPNCGSRYIGYEAPTRLPDGRLGYIVRCVPPNERLDQLYMMAYDFKTGHGTPLLSYPLPTRMVGSGGYSWNPEMTRGINSDGEGRTLEEQLYWITPDDWMPLDLSFPQAYGGAWSPDGQQIAFVAAPEQGRSGIARLDSVYNLYLMSPDGTEVRPLVKGFRYPLNPDWSPDSRWLTLSATFNQPMKQEEGLWLIEAATGKVYQLMSGRIGWAVWSPDGQRLAAVDSTGRSPDNSQNRVIIVEIGPLLDRLTH